MTAIERTAYPRFKRNLTAKDLAEVYTPTPAERFLAARSTKGSVAEVGFLVLLKTYQRLGRFILLSEVPAPILEHIARLIDPHLDVSDLDSYDSSGTRQHHIPLLHGREAFLTCVRISKLLMDIHLHYEQAKEYPLKWIENHDMPFSWRIEKMRLTPDRTAVIVNESLTLSGIPQECFQYRLGNRSALEWVIDQYQVSEDKRSGIVSDPNNLDDEGYIVRLVGKVVTVSVETVRLVNELAQAVKMEDWMSEIEGEN